MLVESSFVRERSDTPKSGVGRAVAMAQEVSEALAAHSKQRPERSDADQRSSSLSRFLRPAARVCTTSRRS
jgi:hypothetical protein